MMKKDNIPPHTDFQRTDSNKPVTQIATFSGPLPPPAALKEYETILPGIAERIIKMAEAEAGHRHKMDEESVRLNELYLQRDFKERRFGQVFGFVIGTLSLAISAIAIYVGAEKAATIIGGTTVVGLVAVFVVGRLKQAE